jgi:hypothetical protein
MSSQQKIDNSNALVFCKVVEKECNSREDTSTLTSACHLEKAINIGGTMYYFLLSSLATNGN